MNKLKNNIIEQKPAKEKSLNLNKCLQTVFDNIESVIFMKDKNFRYEMINKAFEKVFNVNEKDVIGKTDYDIFPKETAKRIRENDEKVLFLKKQITVEESGKISDGSFVYYLSNKVPLFDENGEVYSICGVGTNITNQKAIELELHLLNATKDKFFSIIAHDLKNPFNAIISIAEGLHSNFDDFPDTDKKKLVGLILESSKNAANLLENLLVWAMSQKGEIKVEKEDINLKAIVDESFVPYKGSAENKDISIINNVINSVIVRADNNIINIVIGNLVNNAIKFTSLGGTIRINASIMPEHVEITITDTGIGMSKEVIKKLFRIDESFSTKGTNNEKGSGLGLIICKEFVEIHGGKIWVESKEGKGSIFHFTIPRE